MEALSPSCSPMVIFFTVLFTLLTAGMFAANAVVDPCSPGSYRILDDVRRSASYSPGTDEGLLCDGNLDHGWYRLHLDGQDASIPTICVQMNQCGTRSPVWLSLANSSLPAPGEQRQFSACNSWSSTGEGSKCCLFKTKIRVRNCGAFYIYHLRPTHRCNMAYCAVLSSSTSEPLRLPTKPVIHPRVTNGTVELVCSFGNHSHQAPPPERVFTVIWYRLLPDSRLLIRTVYDVMEMQDAIPVTNFSRLGDKLICEVQMYEETRHSIRNSTFFSEPFFLGIKVEPESLSISEDGSSHAVLFSLTIPYVCPSINPDCEILLQLKTRAISSEMRPADISLSSCGLSITRPETCTSGGGCGSAELMVTAVQDFMDDDVTSSLIEVSLLSREDPFWATHQPQHIKVTTQNVASSFCYAFTDPHFITFDKVRYDLYGTGIFVMYKSTVRTFEVHLRIRSCGNLFSLASCACAFAAREDNDLVILDMCNGVEMPKVTLTSLDAEQTKVRILESRNRKIYTALFPSGSSIRVHWEAWGLSVSAQAPSRDFANTRGLCGFFDSDKTNDFHDTQGSPILSSDQVERFLQAWRVPTGKSLFDADPDAVQRQEQHFCNCYRPVPLDLMKKMTSSALERSNFLYSISSSMEDMELGCRGDVCFNTCRKREHVHIKFLTEYNDVTQEFLLPPEERKSQADIDPFLESDNELPVLSDTQEEDSVEDVSKAREPEYETANSLEADSDEENKSIDEDEDEDDNSNVLERNHVTLTWPTSTGMSEEEVTDLCKGVLFNSTVSKECGHFLTQYMDMVVNICILDVALMDDKSWTSYSLPLLDSLCEESVLSKRLSWKRDSLGNDVVPDRISSALNCPQGCFNSGKCLKHQCLCQPGWNGQDCSKSDETTLPVVIQVGENGFCDVAKTICSKALVEGHLFQKTSSLSCMITEAQFVPFHWKLSKSSMITPAMYQNPTHVECQLPFLTKLTTIYPGPHISWEIRISNDNVHFSKPKYLTVFDSYCQNCVGENSPRCLPQSEACIISGSCYLAEQADPANECQVCSPDISHHHWTPNPRNTAPVVQMPTGLLHAIVGVSFEYRFKAYDPEGGKVTFVMQETWNGAKMSREGTLTWHNPRHNASHNTFTFLALDDCNMTTQFRVQIAVLSCNCENRGTCVVSPSAPPTCVCAPGFTGNQCQRAVDHCSSSPCIHGTCIPNEYGHTCLCDTGYGGNRCEQKMEGPCVPNPCFPGVQCQVIRGGGKCESECQKNKGEGCTSNDPSPGCSGDRCSPGVDCSNLSSGPRFACGPCPPGMTGNGITCTESIKCRGERPCYPGVGCQQIDGQDRCGPCPQGYRGDGANCTAVCSKKCHKNEHCVAPDTCRCRAGYTGSFCHIPLCTQSCLNGGLCVQPDVCRCPKGFTGNRCEIPICEPSCKNNGKCLGRNVCACLVGYAGRTCETAICHRGCLNGGSCVAPNRCECPDGWLGPECGRAFCEQPCQNGGTCFGPGLCACSPGYFGDNCATGVCSPPCRNGGLCIKANKCACSKGWTGAQCEIPVCSAACLNGGKCWRPNKCYCTTGWKGKRCQKPVCRKKCLHGGKCVRPGVCKCALGYYGVDCSVRPSFKTYTRHERHRT